MHVEEKANETTGQYNLAELARQSQADSAEDRAFVRKAASALLSQEEQARALANENRSKAWALVWKIGGSAFLVAWAILTAYLAARGVKL